MSTTSPSSPTMEMYSPTWKGRVKMMVSPAAMFPSTPCIASAMPAPAMPSPAISGSSSTPRFCSAMIANSSSTSAWTTRVSRWRSATSTWNRSSSRSAGRLTHFATNQPTTMMTIATNSLGPNSIA